MVRGIGQLVATRCIAAALALTGSWPLAADVTQSSEFGFTVHHTLHTVAEPSTAYETMTARIDQWWNPEHSWSGDSGNLYLAAEPGGCFCERLPHNGHVEHLRIVYLAPGEEIRFDGSLGPLQQMPVQGRMIWTVEAEEGGSRITFTYHVFGHPDGGLSDIAPAVDSVIGEQLERLGARLAGD